MAELCQSVAELCQSVAELCQSLAEQCQSVAELCQRLAELYQRLAELCQIMAELCQSVAELCQHVAILRYKVAEPYQTVAELCQRVAELCRRKLTSNTIINRSVLGSAGQLPVGPSAANRCRLARAILQAPFCRRRPGIMHLRSPRRRRWSLSLRWPASVPAGEAPCAGPTSGPSASALRGRCARGPGWGRMALQCIAVMLPGKI
jgi:uncharacterized coiled-coil protein SlyX